MACRVSTGLRNEILKSSGRSFADALKNGTFKIFTGSQPPTADDAETGTELVQITLSSGPFTPGNPTNGINLEDAVNGVLSKAVAETWSGVASASGTAGYFRFYDNSMTTGSSNTAIRFDGAIATSGAELNMSSTTITDGGTTTIDSFEVELPTA